MGIDEEIERVKKQLESLGPKDVLYVEHWNDDEDDGYSTKWAALRLRNECGEDEQLLTIADIDIEYAKRQLVEATAFWDFIKELRKSHAVGDLY